MENHIKSLLCAAFVVVMFSGCSASSNAAYQPDPADEVIPFFD